MFIQHCQKHHPEPFEPAVSELQQQKSGRQSLYFILEKATPQADGEASTKVKFKFDFTLNVHRV